MSFGKVYMICFQYWANRVLYHAFSKPGTLLSHIIVFLNAKDGCPISLAYGGYLFRAATHFILFLFFVL